MIGDPVGVVLPSSGRTRADTIVGAASRSRRSSISTSNRLLCRLKGFLVRVLFFRQVKNWRNEFKRIEPASRIPSLAKAMVEYLIAMNRPRKGLLYWRERNNRKTFPPFFRLNP